VRRAVIAAVVVCAARAAHANPADMFGFGARGAAMSGAQVAAADDGSANYYNPALLARLDTIRIELGYQAALPALTVDGQDNDVDSSRGTDLDIAVPGHLAGARFTIGAMIFLPDQSLTRLRNQSAQKPRWALYDNLPQRIVFGANAAMSLGDRFAIGGGISFMAATKGAVSLKGLVGFPRPEKSDLDLSIDVDLDTVRYPVGGVWLRALPWLDLAASYRGGFFLTIDLAFRIDGDVGLPGQDPVVHDGHIALRTVSQDLFQPAQWTVGGLARVDDHFSVAFDLAYHRWSTFQNPSAHIDPPDLDLGPFQGLVNLPPGAPLPDPHFHDIVVPRLGMEWLAREDDARRVFVRGGYHYEPSPAPEQTGESNFIDNDKHTFSLGAGLELRHGLGEIIPRPLSFDLSLALTSLVPRDHHKESAVDPIGDYRSGGHVWQMGLLSRWQF
jgi:long-chain fatty acid transport protein